MAKGEGSKRPRAATRSTGTTIPSTAPTVEPLVEPPNLEPTALLETSKRRLKGKAREPTPQPMETFGDDGEDAPYSEEDIIPAIRDLEVPSDSDHEDDVIKDNLEPIGGDDSGDAEPSPTREPLFEAERGTRHRRPRKERREVERPHTTKGPVEASSFMDQLTPEQRQIYLALEANKDAQMVYVLNLGRELEKKDEGGRSTSRGMMQVNQLPTPPTYDGAYEQSGQKFCQWLTTMEVHLQACAEPSTWASAAAPYLRDYALTWYKSWKLACETSSQPLTWKDMVDGLRLNVTTKYPERHAKKCVTEMTYRGDMQKYISYYQSQLACIPQGDETLSTQLHNFIVKLPPLLREKLQDRQHEFKQLTDAFDRATTLVNNRPDLAKVSGGKEKTEVGLGKRPQYSGTKRKQPGGQGSSLNTQQPAGDQKRGRSFPPKKGPSPSQKAKRDVLMEQRKDDGLCFKCGEPGHQSKECPRRDARPNFDGGVKSIKVSIALTDPLLDNRVPEGNSLANAEEVLLDRAIKAKVDNPGKLILVQLQANNQRGVAMVDTGATANFISGEAVKRMGARVEEMLDPLVCKFANDTQGIVSKVVNHLKVEVIGEDRNFASQERFFVLEGLEVDFILSIAYLRKHGVSLHPSKELLTFPSKGGEPIVVREISENKDKFLKVSKVSWLTPCISAKQWWKDFKGGHECFFFHLHPTKNSATKSKEAKIGPDCGRIPEILEEFNDVLSQKLPKGLPPRREVDHQVELEPGSAPQAKAPYRLNLNERMMLKEALEELVNQGFIRPSKSPYGAPALFVAKKDGTLRLCADYRALNKQTVKNRYPLPHMDDLFDCLSGAKKFSKVDLRSGYYQIRMAEGDEYKTAMRTRFGSYEYLVMPFGLCNATATFMKMMNTIFHDLLDQGVVVFIDDILIYSKTLEEHEQLLKEVFRRLRKAHLYAKPSKCEFAMDEIQFLGHTFTKDGIKPSQDKLVDIKDWERPASAKQVRSFLGFVGFYRRYIKDFARISRPLSALTMKNKVFVWTQDCELAFLELKRQMVSPPVLKLSEVGKPFEIWTDASDYAIGACLHQEGRPVAFESCKLENNWIIPERELYAVIHAIKKWEFYLRNGPKFIVHTDSSPVGYFNSKPRLSPKEMRWQMFLADFDFEVRHVPGKTNTAADALSRKEQYRANSILMLETEWPKVLAAAYEDDRVAQEWRKKGASEGKVRHVSWVWDKDHNVHLWRYKQKRVYIPESLRLEVLRKYHDSPWGGHGGQASTYKSMSRDVYWPDLKESVLHHVQSCYSCQKNRTVYRAKGGLLKPLPVASGPWESISMDFIQGLPTSHGSDSILTIVDRFSKMACFLPTRKTVTAREVASMVFNNVFRYWGLPLHILSDRDSKFTGHFWKALFRLSGTDLTRGSAYHHETDGQTERMNLLLEEYLRHFVAADQKDWSSHMTMAEFRYNSTTNSVTGFAPFLLATGRTPRAPAWFINPEAWQTESKVPAADDFIR